MEKVVYMHRHKVADTAVTMWGEFLYFFLCVTSLNYNFSPSFHTFVHFASVENLDDSTEKAEARFAYHPDHPCLNLY